MTKSKLEGASHLQCVLLKDSSQPTLMFDTLLEFDFVMGCMECSTRLIVLPAASYHALFYQ